VHVNAYVQHAIRSSYCCYQKESMMRRMVSIRINNVKASCCESSYLIVIRTDVFGACNNADVCKKAICREMSRR